MFLNRLVVNPSLDAIEEISLLQNTYDAAYGRSAGGQVNIVVRSGTSDLKGSAYEYFRTSKLDARNSLLPDDNPEPRLRKHQFGGTLGGPIGRWPSFFFTNVELVDGIEADTRLAHVPTAAERSGDFRIGRQVVEQFTQRPFPATDPAWHQRRGANWLTSSDAEPWRDVQMVSSPKGGATHPGDDQTPPRMEGRPIQVRTPSAEDRDLPFRPSPTLPGFGVTVVEEGHQFAHRSRGRRAGVHETRSGNELDSATPTERRHNPFGAIGITPQQYDASRRGTSRRSCRLRNARRPPNCR